MFWPIHDDFAPFEGEFEDPGYDSDVGDNYYGTQGVDELEPSSSQESNPADPSGETDETDDRDEPPALDPTPRPRAITPAELAQSLPNYYSTSSDEEDGASSFSPDSSPARLAIASSTTASTPSGSTTPSLVVTPSEPEEYFDPDYFIHNRPDPIFEPDPSSQSTVRTLDSSDSDSDSNSTSDSNDEEVNMQPLSLIRPTGNLPKIRIPPLSLVANGPRPPLPKIRIPPLAARNLLPNIPSSSAQAASTAGKDDQGRTPRTCTTRTGENLKRRRDTNSDAENRPPLRRSKRVKRT